MITSPPPPEQPAPGLSEPQSDELAPAGVTAPEKAEAEPSVEAVVARAYEAHRLVLLAERLTEARRRDLAVALLPLKRTTTPWDERTRNRAALAYYDLTEAAEQAEHERLVDLGIRRAEEER